MANYVIGMDFGTLSGRGVLVGCEDGRVMATTYKNYTHAVMDRYLPDGVTALPDAWALQVPEDYLEVLREVIPALLEESHVSKDKIVGLSCDFTSCTMLPIDEQAVPLCQKEAFVHRPHAYAKLWKHHGAQAQADRINELLDKEHLANLPRYGGRVSSEMMLPKMMEILEEDPEIYQETDEFLEAGDWITRVLTGSHRRGISTASYKMWWNKEEGYPSGDLFAKLAPELKNLVKEKLPGKICPIGDAVGYLSEQWAKELGLSAGIPVGPNMIDSHAGVVGSGLSGEGQMAMILGTSGAFIGFGKKPFSDRGVIGGAKDTIAPGYYAIESGLAALGDLFGWFVDSCVPMAYEKEAVDRGITTHQLLTEKASLLSPGQSGLMVLDFWNGNKTPYVEGNLTGQILGLTLNTLPEEIYRACIEATAFGARRIMEIFEEQGMVIREIIASGGIAKKNPLLMSIYADVLGKPIRLTSSEQTVALGAAVMAALSAGVYSTYEEAVRHMCHTEETVYLPNEKHIESYDKLYEIYKEASDLMASPGREGRGMTDALLRLKRVYLS